MAFYFYLSTKIIMVFITKSYQDLFGVRSYINALFGTRYLKKKMIILTIFMYFTSFYTKNKIITLHLTNITTKQYL